MGIYLDASHPERSRAMRHTCSQVEVQSNLAPRCQDPLAGVISAFSHWFSQVSETAEEKAEGRE